MSTNKYVISQALMKVLDELVEGMGKQILDGDIDEDSFADYYAEYQGVKRVRNMILSFAFDTEEEGNKIKDSFMAYDGLVTPLGDEEMEDD